MRHRWFVSTKDTLIVHLLPRAVCGQVVNQRCNPKFLRGMNFLRVFQSASTVLLRKGSQTAFRGVQPLPQLRTFSAAQYKDVPYMIGEDDEADPSTIKVPILRDSVKQEMFLKYMGNQEQWSIENLAKAYGTSLIRTKAVILLMQRRHAMIVGDEKRLRDLLEDGNNVEEKASSDVSSLRVRPDFSVPPVLQTLYAKHLEDTTVAMDVLISSYNETVSEVDGGKRVSIGEKELKTAFSIIARHAQRRENLEAALEEQEEDLEECAAAGIDVGTFRESPTEFATSKAANYSNRKDKHIRRTFQDTYYPNLQNDEGAKREELKLLQRIERETKAQLQHDVEFYERLYSARSPAQRLEEARSTALPGALQYHQPKREGAPMSRFKIAFQDLSLSAVPQTKKHLRVPDRTVVRTRGGELRYATPMEESNMSWRVRPFGVDRALGSELPHNYARLVQPYLDVDRDEQAAAALVAERRQRRKAQLAAAGVAK